MGDEKKMFEYLKGYFEYHKYQNSLKSLHYAMEKHEHQNRKNGKPYIIHPLGVTYLGIYLQLGFDNDIQADKQCSVNLLHDVPEDCGDNLSSLEVDQDIKTSANILDFNYFKRQYPNDKHYATFLYYQLIQTNQFASFCKLLDRYHNLSTYGKDFIDRPEKILNYLAETKEFPYPLMDFMLEHFSKYSTSLLFLQNGMEAFVRDADARALGEIRKRTAA